MAIPGEYIILTPFERRMARSIGKLRDETNRQKGRKHRYNVSPNPEESLAMNVYGAEAELLVAKVLNRYWSSPFFEGEIDREAADVGEKIQVRATKHLRGSLLVHPTDRDDDWFVLVVGEGDSMRVVGGMLGVHAKQPQYWQEKVKGRPCYFVPQEDLLSIARLRREAR